MIYGVEYTVVNFWRINVPWCIRHLFWDKVFAFSHPFWDKEFPFHTPKKLCMVRLKTVPPQHQQEEERFSLPDLAAAPQIKKH